MTMNDFRKCETCEEFGFTNSHVCPPVWEARVLDTKHEGSWVEVHADDVESAAIKFAEQYDNEGDFDIINRGGEDVEVRKPGEAEVSIVEITAEAVPAYYGYVRSTRGEAA